MKVIISESGKLEIDRLQFDIRHSIDSIFRYIPKGDILGLDHILVTELPLKKKGHDHSALGAYFKRQGNRQAHVELYVKNLFGHLKSAESFRQMLPVQEFGLAQTIYHEVGHHVREVRTHGLKRNRSENFAESYTLNILNRYVLDNAKSINSCFKSLKGIAKDKGLSLEVIRNMKLGWEKSYKEALKSTVH
jgi:hypothetical protein